MTGRPLRLMADDLTGAFDSAVRARMDESGAIFAGLVGELDPPDTLPVSGGETLRGLCEALECGALTVIGERLPGIPCSIMAGGWWGGVRVVSKSGAFGTADLFRTFLPASAGTASGAYAA